MLNRPRALGLTATLLGLAVLGCSSEPARKPPNIVVFLLDTVRADAIELDEAGPAITPNLRELAREGVTFSAAFTHTTWTKPAIATLFTSRFPTQHTLRNIVFEENNKLVAGRLPEELTTLAEHLQAGGYRTAGIITQAHLRPKYGFDQGFDDYHLFRGLRGPALNRKLQEWLARRSERGVEETAAPFFLYMHYLDAHWPYRNRVEELGPKLGPVKMDPEPPLSAALIEPWLERGPSAEALRALEVRYLHGVAKVDRLMGEALAILEGAGLMNDTVVLVISDHGEGLGEHDKFLHGFAPYEELHRIPMVVRLPKRLRGEVREVSTLVGLVDIQPTLLDLAGLPAGEGDMGRSLLPLMQGADQGWRRPIFSETEGVRSLRTAERKLILYPDGRREFFDLTADPLEQSPLPCDEGCRELAQQLARLAGLLEESSRPDASSVELEESDREILEALGYLNK